MFNNILLQIGLTPATDSSNVLKEEGVKKTTNVIELLWAGGWIMIPIGLLLIVAVYLILERLISLKKADRDPETFLENIRSMVVKGDISAAQEYCKSYNSPFSRMIDRGLAKLGTPLKNIEASIENVGKIEVYQLEKNLGLLATISGLGPMLGFLGTVTGLVRVFTVLADKGTVSTQLFSGGIYEAMITTIAGLMVGIIAYAGYNYLVGKVKKIIHQMEYASIEFLELLQQPNS